LARGRHINSIIDMNRKRSKMTANRKCVFLKKKKHENKDWSSFNHLISFIFCSSPMKNISTVNYLSSFNTNEASICIASPCPTCNDNWEKIWANNIAQVITLLHIYVPESLVASLAECRTCIFSFIFSVISLWSFRSSIDTKHKKKLQRLK
jgi:hypothetical protein